MALTVGQLKEATCSKLVHATKFLPHIQKTLDRFNITTPAQQLCFLSQVGHESGGLFYTEEIATGDAYENRKDLGNTQKGDGRKYKGRGLIQITGRINYTHLSNDLKVDFINNPSILGGKIVDKCSLQQLENAALSAGWFWDKHKINTLADKIDLKKSIDLGTNKDAFIKITKVINGGTNGLQDRFNRYKAGLHFFLTA